MMRAMSGGRKPWEEDLDMLHDANAKSQATDKAAPILCTTNLINDASNVT